MQSPVLRAACETLLQAERIEYERSDSVGGNERMVCQYMDICKNHGCKAKVYVKENGSLKKKLGTPDYLLLFTSTVSHKMMLSASKEAKRNNIPIAYVPSSSASALHSVLADCCAAVRGERAFNA